MSIIAWDGTTVAADKRACIADAAHTTTKLWQVHTTPTIFLGITGDESFGLSIKQWFLDGADPAKWPAFQITENWARLVVFEQGKRPYTYERNPVKQVVEDPFMAWGTGREFALGALAMGATAKEAVEVACRFSIYCGNGVDVFNTR